MDLEKVKNAAIVIILTCLIWVTAEQAVTRSDLVRVRLQIPQNDGDTIIEFLDDKGLTLPENKLDVKFTVEGTTSRVSQAARLNSTVFDINTAAIDIVPQPGTSEVVSVKVSDLMGGKFKVDDKDHYLLISESTPHTVNVKVTRLVKRMVPVVVYHLDKKLTPETISPKEVEAYVLGDKNTEAIVALTDKQRLEANEKAIDVKAVVFTQYRNPTEFNVSVKISPIVSVIPERAIDSPRFGVLWPLTMEGQYRVVIDDKSAQYDEYQQAIICRGTKELIDAYYASPVHLMIVMSAEDLAIIDKPIDRIPIYNLPQGGSGIEIVNQKKSPIRFTIEKLTVN